MRLRAGIALLALVIAAAARAQSPRARARELGVAPGIFSPGRHNAITDVSGVRVGHATVVLGDSLHTGVTSILPHGGNLFLDRVPAAVRVGNAFGKLVGATQLRGVFELEPAILLPGTLCGLRPAH